MTGHFQQFFSSVPTDLLPSNVLFKLGIQSLERFWCADVLCVPIACVLRYAEASAQGPSPRASLQYRVTIAVRIL